jgi:hypothetical protein
MNTLPSSAIPRKLHVLWLQGERDLAERKPDLAAIVRHNETCASAASPPWAFRVWSEGDVLRECWPRLDGELASRLGPMLASCPSHAARSDILRLVLLLAEGGLYLDTDMLLVDDFDWLLHSPGPEDNAAQPSLVMLHDTSLTQTDSWIFGSRGNNCFFAAAPAHAFVRDLLQEIAAAQPYVGAQPFPDTSGGAIRWTMRTTGPELYERVLESPKWWQRACAPGSGIRLLPGVLVDPQAHRHLAQRTTPASAAPGRFAEPAAASPRQLQQSMRAANPSAVAVHLADNSWVGGGTVRLKRAALAVREWAHQNWMVVQLVLLLALVVMIAAAGVLLRRLTQTREQRIASLRRKLSRKTRRS